MSEAKQQRAVRVINGIEELGAERWNAQACAPGRPRNPFVRYEFLEALERSGSVSDEAGWQPFHLVLEAPASDAAPAEVCGVLPQYVKAHSQGEYVFDYGWADALHRAGGRYYPKLQCSIPFTPATGPRLLCQSPEDEAALLAGSVQVAQQVEVSSLHMTFMTEAQWHLAGSFGFLKRMDQQFHWHNAGYENFDGFLAELSSKKRKNLRRERRDALAAGVEIEWVTGSDLREHHWDAFYRFYLDTGSRKWGSPYLNREFFSLVSEAMPEDILLILCKAHGDYIAGALNFIGEDTLYGRNWGCTEHHPFLHFETCYYQAIDFAIDHGLARVEAGAQGSHKVARGYLPQATYSAHWISDPRFRQAVSDYLENEREYVAEDIEHVERHTPFRNDVDLRERSPASLPVKDPRQTRDHP